MCLFYKRGCDNVDNFKGREISGYVVGSGYTHPSAADDDEAVIFSIFCNKQALVFSSSPTVCCSVSAVCVCVLVSYFCSCLLSEVVISVHCCY